MIADMNKDNMMTWLKVLLVIFLIGCAVIPNVEIWNIAAVGGTDGFHVVFSILNFLIEGFGIYWVSKNVLFKEKKQETLDHE